ncbi:uncharacterized protein LOC141653872 [Silene latifolia]|uniref:uncharacterized protein LOC141653872 n=1 Tax=Silene latifolia TaxID=37657 RepID=UPI003D77EF52
MGNYSSCFKAQSKNSKVAKLVDSQGQVKLVNLPTTVVEIMLDNPGFALSPVDELQRTKRIPVMKADDILLGRKVYLLVPVDKVNSRLSDLQLAAIDSLVCSCNENVRKQTRTQTRGGSKVSPVVETGVSGENLEELAKSLTEKSTGLAGQRNNGFGKAWAPVLEPILEVC